MSSSDETFWSYFVDVPVKICGATTYTATEKDGKPKLNKKGEQVYGVRARLSTPVEKDGSKYSVLKTEWEVVVNTLRSEELQKKFAEGAELPVKAIKAPGKMYYILAKP